MYPICFKFVINRPQICVTRNFSNSVFSKSSLFQCKRPQGQWRCLKPQASNFHTTQKVHSPWFLALNIGSIISGSYLRYWWLKKTPMEQQKYLKWYKNKQHMIHGSLAITCLVIIAYCSTFIKRDPLTNKPRFTLYTEAQEAEKSNIFLKLIVSSRDNVVPLSDPMYSRIANVMRRLARSNPTIFQDTDWSVTIVNRMFGILSSPTILILSGGHIIVIADMFKFIRNDDQLAFNLAHEIAHRILLHPAETLSLELIRTLIIDLTWFLFFAINPASNAAIRSLLAYILSIIVFCWYKRINEAEADKIGFEIAAKCCIDPREVLVFWELVKKYKDQIMQDKLEIPIVGKLFDIHPPVEKRIEKIISYIPKALQLRNEANCPELPDEDPRDKLPEYLKEFENKSQVRSIKLRL